MSATGLLIGLLNCILVAVILMLLGAVVQWFLAKALEWPAPPNVVKLYIAVVALVFIICVASLLLGMPMVHIFHA